MKNAITTAMIAVLLTSAAAAYAGTRAQVQVTVNATSRYAYGAMADARGSADTVQQINCATNTTLANCWMVNSAGVGGSCYTTDPAMINVIRGISGESYVYIKWNTDGSCSYVLVQNSSFMKPGAVSGY
ncbi:MAG: hypothetical protein E6Q88_05170 [Lysobacteraceae bacterium]|nr:MAG: hypothetical protein E6Q88_05170 [Xanthomonadaceae bacterium]